MNSKSRRRFNTNRVKATITSLLFRRIESQKKRRCRLFREGVKQRLEITGFGVEIYAARRVSESAYIQRRGQRLPPQDPGMRKVG